jgi:hypothetical protein
MKVERAAIVNSLVLLLALGSGLALVLTKERATTEERAERDNNLFVEFPRDRLRRITIQKKTERFVLERDANPDAGPRRFTLAGEGTCDPEAVESLLRSLELAAYLKRFEAKDSDRKNFGLDAPRAEITLEFEDSESHLRVGKAATAVHDATYVEVEAGPRRDIGLIRNSALEELLVGKDALRPRALAPAATEARALSFREGKIDVQLHRGAGTSWLDASGQRVRRDGAEHLLLELGSVKIEPFVALATARPLLEHDHLSIVLQPKAAKGGTSPPALTVRIGGACPSEPSLLLAERSAPNPSAGCVPAGVRQVFEDAAAALTDLGTFSLHTDEVETLLIERDNQKLELVRNDRGFLLLSPTRADVALDTGNRRLDRVLKATGEPIPNPDLAALGLAPALAKVTVRSSTVEDRERFAEVLELGRADARGRLPVRRVEDQRVLLLSRDAARAFALDSTLLRPTKLLDFGPSQLKSVEVTWDHEHEVLRRKENGEYELSAPDKLAHDGALTLDLVQALGTLSAARWVADSDDGSFGLAAPRVQARLTVTPAGQPDKVIVLRVGDNAAGGAFAALDSEPGVFIIERSVVDTLTTLLLTRGAFARDPEGLARIELERRGARLTLTRKGDHFESVPPVPEAMLAGVVESVGSLRAEGAIHTGAARADEGFSAPTLSVRLIPNDPKLSITSFRVGARDVYRDAAIFYGRVAGIDATFALPLGSVKALTDAL